MLAKADDLREQWRILALLIRAAVPTATGEQIARITGLKPNYVAKIHSQYLRHGVVPFAYLHGRGGHTHGVETEKGRARKMEKQKEKQKEAIRSAKFEKYVSEGMKRPVARMKAILEETLGRTLDEAFVRSEMRRQGIYLAGEQME